MSTILVDCGSIEIERQKLNKFFIYMGTREEVSCVIRTCFQIFLCDHVLRFGHYLNIYTHSYFHLWRFTTYAYTYFHLCGWIPSEGLGLPIKWYPFERIGFFGKFNYFRWHIWCYVGVVEVFQWFYMGHLSYEII